MTLTMNHRQWEEEITNNKELVFTKEAAAIAKAALSTATTRNPQKILWGAVKENCDLDRMVPHEHASVVLESLVRYGTRGTVNDITAALAGMTTQHSQLLSHEAGSRIVVAILYRTDVTSDEKTTLVKAVTPKEFAPHLLSLPFRNVLCEAVADPEFSAAFVSHLEKESAARQFFRETLDSKVTPHNVLTFVVKLLEKSKRDEKIAARVSALVLEAVAALMEPSSQHRPRVDILEALVATAPQRTLEGIVAKMAKWANLSERCKSAHGGVAQCVAQALKRLEKKACGQALVKVVLPSLDSAEGLRGHSGGLKLLAVIRDEFSEVASKSLGDSGERILDAAKLQNAKKTMSCAQMTRMSVAEKLAALRQKKAEVAASPVVKSPRSKAVIPASPALSAADVDKSTAKRARTDASPAKAPKTAPKQAAAAEAPKLKKKVRKVQKA